MKEVQINTEAIPEELVKEACTILNASVRNYIATHQAEFEKWRQAHEQSVLSMPRTAQAMPH